MLGGVMCASVLDVGIEECPILSLIHQAMSYTILVMHGTARLG